MTNAVQSQDAQKLTALYEADMLLKRARQLAALGRSSEAEQAIKQAIEKRRSVLGAEDAQVAFAMQALGDLYRRMQRYDEAEAQLKQVLEIVEMAYYAEHANVAMVLYSQAQAFVAQGKDTEAEPVLKRALDICGKTLTAEHRLALEITRTLSMVYRQLGKFGDAEQLLTKAIKHVDTPLGPLADFQLELAQVYQGAGKNEEAERAYKLAASAFEKRARFTRLADCLESYAALLKTLNRLDEAQRIANRAKIYADFGQDPQEENAFLPSTLLRT